jgi:hypothetical protein
MTATATTTTTAEKTSPNTKIWKLLLAALLHAGLIVGVPFLLQRLKVIDALKPQAYVVLVFTWAGLGIKLLVGDVASDKFEYHKHGYDFCLLTMGTALSMLSLQLLSEDDLLKGLSAGGPLVYLSKLSPNAATQHAILLATLFLITAFLSLLTARISRAITIEKSKGSDLLAMLNFSVGATTFGAYLFLLLSKVA